MMSTFVPTAFFVARLAHIFIDKKINKNYYY